MRTYYQIDGDNNHVWAAYTQRERLKYLNGSWIAKVVNDEAVTTTPIIVTADGYSFGKTVRL